MRPEDRERIQIEVVSRVVERCVEEARRSGSDHLDLLIQDTLYHERRRLEGEPPDVVRAEAPFYDELQRRLRHASPSDRRDIVTAIARRFVAEVVGNFDERVYRLSTRLIPPGLQALLTATSLLRLLSPGRAGGGLAEHLRVEGELDHVRALLQHGTLVVVPTHLSNLDSVVMGYVAYLIGLPPLCYGAGLNLFTNPLLSFFMRNLGAYKVDRKKTCILYKEVLKEYATCSLEMGYHNLFFPGGTRSRSGAIESKLKLGLLGTGVRAYIDNLLAGRARPNVYVVPCSISYMLVLEAETLIADHLKETGRSRYIIEDDEFSRPRRILNFLSSIMSLDSQISITFGAPLDVFGNRVNTEGQSMDARGRVIDARPYVCKGGKPVHDAQRDAQYTRELADEVCREYLRQNVVMPTHLLAWVLMQALKRRNPGLDLYRMLRTGGEVASFPMQEVHAGVERALRPLKERSPNGDVPWPRLAPVLQGDDVQAIVAEGLKYFGIYHTRPPARRRGDRVFHEDRNLLLYYGNRLRGYELERAVAATDPTTVAAASTAQAAFVATE